MTSRPVKSNRGSELVYDSAGYEYRRYRIDTSGLQIYRCNTYKCTGKAKKINGQITECSTHKPAHLPPDHSDEVRVVKEKVKEQRKLGVPTVAVINNNVLGAPNHLKPLLNTAALTRFAQRSVEVHGRKDWPATIDPTVFANTFFREDTCHLFPKGDPRGYKIFASDFGLSLLRSCLDWCADGTFYSSPFDFEQILIIGVQEGHLMTPCLFAFLSSKMTSGYESIFSWINTQGVPGPLTITCDFELGLTNAVTRIYPTVSIARCAFHLYQAIFRKIQNLGLTDLYRSPNTKKYYKCIMALSLIPPQDIPSYFEEIKDEAMDNVPASRVQKTEEIFDYFENSYIGVKAQNGIRMSPAFPPSTWSIYSRIINGQQIGNSTMEGFNSKLQTVPPGSSAQKVAVILSDHDKAFSDKHEMARLQQLTVVQAFPQSSQVFNRQNRRKIAVSNGPMGQSVLDHLTALATHIRTPF